MESAILSYIGYSTIVKMLRGAVVFMLIVIMAGCSENPSRHDQLRIGLTEWMGYQPLLWAKKRYLPEGFADFIELPSNSESVRLFNSGIRDVACVTLDDALRLTMYENDVEVIAILDISHGGDVLVTKPEVESLEGLKGSRIGFEKAGAGSFMLYRILKQAGLEQEDVVLHNVDAYNHADAFRTGKVDAVVTYEPFASELVSIGGVKRFDSTMVPNEVFDLLIVRKSVLRSHRKEIVQLLDAWYKAASDVRRGNADAYSYFSRLLGMTPLELESAYSGIRFPAADEVKQLLLGGEFERSITRMKRILGDMGQYTQSKKPVRLFERKSIESLY